MVIHRVFGSNGIFIPGCGDPNAMRMTDEELYVVGNEVIR